MIRDAIYDLVARWSAGARLRCGNLRQQRLRIAREEIAHVFTVPEFRLQQFDRCESASTLAMSSLKTTFSTAMGSTSRQAWTRSPSPIASHHSSWFCVYVRLPKPGGVMILMARCRLPNDTLNTRSKRTRTNRWHELSRRWPQHSIGISIGRSPRSTLRCLSIRISLWPTTFLASFAASGPAPIRRGRFPPQSPAPGFGEKY